MSKKRTSERQIERKGRQKKRINVETRKSKRTHRRRKERKRLVSKLERDKEDVGGKFFFKKNSNESATRQGLSLPKLQHLGLRGGFRVVFSFSLSTTCSIQVGCSH